LPANGYLLAKLMPLSEFDVIERYFNVAGAQRDDVVLGIGDDAALLRVPADRALAVAIDTLLEDRHFLSGSDAFDIGYKSLAVNLSDLAAIGAEPAWATLSLSLPSADGHWLQAFADGFFSLARRFNVQLVGGDTTRGPLSVTVQVHGFVEPDRALRRSGAQPGDKVYVTGSLGDAACALHQLQAGHAGDPLLVERLNRPVPRVHVGRALTRQAHAAIDISDGLLADLNHIARASRCGATLWVDRLPRSTAFAASCDPEWVLPMQLSGGDDYELCFCVDPERAERLPALAAEAGVTFTEVGVMEKKPGIRCRHDDGSIYSPRSGGFDHFA
jgi:thiamine-monophosphate kinase